MSTRCRSGRGHGLMELCPEKPGRVECRPGFIEGECDAIACVAFAGLAAPAIQAAA